MIYECKTNKCEYSKHDMQKSSLVDFCDRRFERKSEMYDLHLPSISTLGILTRPNISVRKIQPKKMI